MKSYYWPAFALATLAWMAGCDDVQQPQEPAQPPPADQAPPPDNALPPEGQPPAGDQSGQFPGPGSYLDESQDQSQSNATAPQFDREPAGIPADASSSAGISEAPVISESEAEDGAFPDFSFDDEGDANAGSDPN